MVWVGMVGAGTGLATAQTQPEVFVKDAEISPSANDGRDEISVGADAAIAEQMSSVSQLTDVQPTDWAYQALQSLVEQYQCLAASQTFQGDRALSRQEFAAGLKACLDSLAAGADRSIAARLNREDLVTLERLQQEFSAELIALEGSVEALEAQLAQLETHAFSTTTTLSGQAIVAVNAGGFSGDRIISPLGGVISRDQPNPTLLYRFSLDLNTSFSGTDLLKLRLLAASPGSGDNAAGALEPNLGSATDFAVPGTQQLSVARLYYTFAPTPDLSLTIGPRLVATDFIDQNRYANVSFRDFSTQALVNNFLLLPRPAGAGAVISWRSPQAAIALRAVYIAASATENLPENQQLLGGGQPGDIRLFPTQGGGAEGGLFGDPYLGALELEYAPVPALKVRLQSSIGKVLGSNFHTLGANIDYSINQQLGLFARYAYSSYSDTTLGDIRPNYWSAGVALQDVFVESDLAGMGVAQPFILREVGNATQTNLEVFYNFPISQNLRLTPLLQVITHAGNQSSNDTILVGTLRTVFSF